MDRLHWWSVDLIDRTQKQLLKTFVADAQLEPMQQSLLSFQHFQQTH